MTVLVLNTGASTLVDKKLPSSNGGAVRYQIAGSTDVASVQPDGTLQRRPSSSDGAYEQFFEKNGYSLVTCQRDGATGVPAAFAAKLTGDPLS